jgi:hypothetical protein
MKLGVSNNNIGAAILLVFILLLSQSRSFRPVYKLCFRKNRFDCIPIDH